MKYQKLLLLLTVGFFLFSGCQTLGVQIQSPGSPPPQKKYHKKGPPPHAPAHGYRHKHRGHELEYRSQIGAYVVLNIPETYFGNNLYIRMSTDGKWIVSATLEGGWRIAAGSEVPSKLKETKHKTKKKKKHKKNKSKKKHKYNDE